MLIDVAKDIGKNLFKNIQIQEYRQNTVNSP